MKKIVIVLMFVLLSISSAFSMGQSDQVRSTTISGGYQYASLNFKDIDTKTTTSGFGVKLDSVSSRPEKHNWNAMFSLGAYFPNVLKMGNSSAMIDVTATYKMPFVFSFTGGATYSFIRTENVNLAVGPVINFQSVNITPKSGYGFSHIPFGFGAILDASFYLGEVFYLDAGVSATYSPFGIYMGVSDTEFTTDVSGFDIEPKIGFGFSF